MRFVILLMLLCAGAPAAAQGLRIVADVGPVARLGEALVGPIATVTPLVGPGANPHHLTLRPSQVRAIQDADVIIGANPVMSPWLASILRSAAPNTPVVWIGLDHHHDADMDEDAAAHHSHRGIDPHTWMNLDLATAFLTNLKAQLLALHPDLRQQLDAGHADALTRMDQERRDFATFMASFAQRPIVVSHNSWTAVHDAFGLNIVGHLSGGGDARPGPAHVARLRATVRDHDVTCFVKHPLERDTVFASLARPVTAVTVSVDAESTPPEGNLTILPALADALARC